jgi:hypothetical protein
MFSDGFLEDEHEVIRERLGARVVVVISVAWMPLWHQQSPANDHFRFSTHSRSALPDVGRGAIFASVIQSLLLSRSSDAESVELELPVVMEGATTNGSGGGGE